MCFCNGTSLREREGGREEGEREREREGGGGKREWEGSEAGGRERRGVGQLVVGVGGGGTFPSNNSVHSEN